MAKAMPRPACPEKATVKKKISHVFLSSNQTSYSVDILVMLGKNWIFELAYLQQLEEQLLSQLGSVTHNAVQ